MAAADVDLDDVDVDVDSCRRHFLRGDSVEEEQVVRNDGHKPEVLRRRSREAAEVDEMSACLFA